ncbi:hypothetical protein B0T26DRAFT_734951 [Lasiosphaeria miniovina]|uniref:Uncharacterized protein n=1 Tax=Lasiosphaeria miniovina TaxID=1954250 RepID=A0AA40DIB1_9PEZI|nr:uncharacterized protein B0T26DRAFT_734951 [Lasiosphaeria miniovina]KAK0701857.1 hypothetical protein B0T26DRAFT_734951 [Lasiosphaeria miniovina]
MTTRGWLRPGCTGPKVIHVALLRTCRRVCLETAHIPARHIQLLKYNNSDETPPWSTMKRGFDDRGWPHARSSLAETIPLHTLARVRDIGLFGFLF